MISDPAILGILQQPSIADRLHHFPQWLDATLHLLSTSKYIKFLHTAHISIRDDEAAY